jgi:hypothetical protein
MDTIIRSFGKRIARKKKSAQAQIYCKTLLANDSLVPIFHDQPCIKDFISHLIGGQTLQPGCLGASNSDKQIAGASNSGN